jgi:hypothetical protein
MDSQRKGFDANPDNGEQNKLDEYGATRRATLLHTQNGVRPQASLEINRVGKMGRDQATKADTGTHFTGRTRTLWCTTRQEYRGQRARLRVPATPYTSSNSHPRLQRNRSQDENASAVVDSDKRRGCTLRTHKPTLNRIKRSTTWNALHPPHS